MAKHLKQGESMHNKTYDILKWVALVCLPATSALYVTLALKTRLSRKSE